MNNIAIPVLAQCIYCLDRKPVEQFSTEHVIHSSMTARFEPVNLTLIDNVCGACNQHLGDTIDRAIGRGYWEGMARFKHDLKSIDKIHQLSHQNIDFNVADPAAFRSEIGDFTDALRDHLRLELEDGQVVRLTTQQLLDHPLQELIDLDQVTGFRVITETDEGDREIRRLIEPILSTAGFEIKQGLLKHQLSATVTYDRIAFRAIAKVAFNYLAKVSEHSPHVVLAEPFDEIRSFIRYDHTPSFHAVQHDAGRDKFIYCGTPLNGHWITLEMQANQPKVLTARLSLFNMQAWTVILCPNYKGTLEFLPSAHIWDLKTRRCESTTARPRAI